MQSAEWKTDDEGKAIYVDLKLDKGVEKDWNEDTNARWDELPDLVLEEIFSYLTIEKRYHASLVCRSWYRAFYMPGVWSTFVLDDHILSRRKFNLYMGWQRMLDHIRTHVYMHKMAHHIRQLIVAPMENYFNLFEFLSMLANHAYRNPHSLDHLSTLKFTFSCDLVSRSEKTIYGTGGQCLDSLKRLMVHLTGLRKLELVNLLLDSTDGLNLLNDVSEQCYLTLRSLALINTTKYTCQLLHPGVFLNLETLYISPQSLGPDLLWLLSQTKLRHLHIVQNVYTETGYSVDSKYWYDLTRSNAVIRVHLSNIGKTKREMIWQDRAPVSSILYDSPYSQVKNSHIIAITDIYQDKLRTYGHLSLPRFHTSKSFLERIDSSMLLLVRQCSNLHTLVIRERISTYTLLLIAMEGKKLRKLYVRKNALLVRSDWPCKPEWSAEFYIRLKSIARSYELTRLEVSRLISHSWEALTDSQFKAIKINVHIDT